MTVYFCILRHSSSYYSVQYVPLWSASCRHQTGFQTWSVHTRGLHRTARIIVMFRTGGLAFHSMCCILMTGRLYVWCRLMIVASYLRKLTSLDDIRRSETAVWSRSTADSDHNNWLAGPVEPRTWRPTANNQCAYLPTWKTMHTWARRVGLYQSNRWHSVCMKTTHKLRTQKYISWTEHEYISKLT